MRDEDCQPNKKESSKLNEKETQEILKTDSAQDHKFNQGNQICHLLEEENKTFLKIKRHREPQELDIAKHTIIRNINAFLNEYIAFLNNPLYNQVTDKLKNQNDFTFINENKYALSHFYNIAKKYNNYGELIANNIFNEFAKQVDIFKNGQEARRIYDYYLFHFIELKRLENNLKLSPDPQNVQKKMIDYLGYDPSYLMEVPIIECNTNDKDEINNLIIEGLKYDLVILRGFLDKFGFTSEYFTEKFIVENYKNQKIEVIEQAENFYGFTNNVHNRQIWTIEELGKYLDYKRNQHKYLNSKVLGELKIDVNKIYFGVNLDMDHMETPREEIRNKINPLLNFSAFDDALSYMRETINGMNLPQFYIKEKGVWTGGHEENCRIRSININHGPEGSEWYGVKLEDAKVFSEYLKKTHEVNIYLKEGLWYENWEYFLKNKLKVLYTTQKAGDIILVGPGCIHWVRSLGNAVHSSWNFFPKEKIQFETALDRYKVNREIKMRSLVPLYTLMIDIMNFEMYYLDLDLVKFCFNNLQELFRISNKTNSNILMNPLYSHISIKKELDSQNIVVCENCYDEIFNLWVYAEKFVGTRKEKHDLIMCPVCFEKEFKYIDSDYPFFISYKYETQDLKKLLERVNKRIEIEEGKSLCNGEIDDEFQISLVKINKDTIFNSKIKSEFIKKNINDEKLTVFSNKKNPIYNIIPSSKILEHILNNFEKITNFNKPIYNEISEQLEGIRSEKLLNLLKGCKKNNLTFNQNNKENDLDPVKLNDPSEENKDNILFSCEIKSNSKGESDSLFAFYEETNLKLFEGSLQDANLELNKSKNMKEKNATYDYHINENIFYNDDEDKKVYSNYNSKIIIPYQLEYNGDLEIQSKQNGEFQNKITNENNHVIKRENNEETISNSFHENQEEVHGVHTTDLVSDKSKLIRNNYTAKNSKVSYDGIEFDFSSYEIQQRNSNNGLSKYLIYKKVRPTNISKLTTYELIKIIQKNSKSLSIKNPDVGNKEFNNYKNQRKKFKNNLQQKKSLNRNNQFIHNDPINNFENGKDVVNPFDIENIKKSEIGITGNSSPNENQICEKLKDLFHKIENYKNSKNLSNVESIIRESEKYIDNSAEYDESISYIQKSLIFLKSKTRDREKFDYLLKKIENKYNKKNYC